jgi:hypothetical protein
MLSRREAREWAAIERHLAGELPPRVSVLGQTLIPLLLAGLFAALALPTPALFCLFAVPCGLVTYMVRTPPPAGRTAQVPSSGAR